tara:strand:+ start:385 stop:1401 length:1017 start_codon:yes stop_codon:yes gene_type:complete
LKAVIVRKPRIVGIEDRAVPDNIKNNEVRLKVKKVGICGSDLHIYQGTNPFATYPRIIGHEFGGKVDKLGSDVEKINIGDHVVIDPVSSCGFCNACKLKRQNVCKNLAVTGVHKNGGMQEYIVLPTLSIHKIPLTFSWETAALIEPFTIAAQASSRGKVAASDKVCIIGAGPIGIATMMVCKMFGAEVLITDINSSRLSMAKDFGADATINPLEPNEKQKSDNFTNKEGFNVVIDAAGFSETFEKAVNIASPAGRIVILGFNERPSKIIQKEITKKELDIMGSRLHTNKFPEVIKWVEKGLIKPDKLITHYFHFSNIQEAIKLIEKSPDGLCKTIINF